MNGARPFRVAGAGLLAIAVLTGCASSPPEDEAHYADLARAADERDVLPSAVETTQDGVEVDVETVRLAAENDGTLVFLARGTQGGEDSVCLVLTGPGDEDWGLTCSIVGGSFGDDRSTYFVVPDDAGPERLPQDISLTRLSENVYVSPAAAPEEVQ